MINLFEMARRLSEAGVRFVIVGGIAIRSHGGNYITEDLVFVIREQETILKSSLIYWPR